MQLCKVVQFKTSQSTKLVRPHYNQEARKSGVPCGPSHMGGGGRMTEAKPPDSTWKITKAKNKSGDVAQVVESLPSKGEGKFKPLSW
jgi:hypothetical protein